MSQLNACENTLVKPKQYQIVQIYYLGNKYNIYIIFQYKDLNSQYSNTVKKIMLIGNLLI
jgi:hypothetical protein